MLGSPAVDRAHIEDLARKLEHDNLVLFVGAGISHQAKPYDGSKRRLPLWRELAAEVGQICGDDIKNYDGKLLDLFDAIVSRKDRTTLEEAVRTAIPASAFEPTEVHQIIAKLPWHITYTTNYDDLLSRSFGGDFISNEKEYEWLRRPKKPRLIHLHGTLANPSTLSGTDYRNWATKNPIAHEQLTHIALYKTILFTGYSFSDPYLNDGVLTWIRDLQGERANRNYAWMWRVNREQRDLLRDRDKINVSSLNEDEDWLRAFQQIENTLSRGGSSALLAMRRTTKPKNDDPAQETDHAIINGYKLFYYRHKLSMSPATLSKKTGIEARKLRRLETVKKSSHSDERCFHACSDEDISRIESALNIPRVLEYGLEDDFSSMFTLYYKIHRKAGTNRSYQSQLPFSVNTRAVVFDFGGTLTQPTLGPNTWERLWASVGYSNRETGKLHRDYMDRRITHQQWCDKTAVKLKEAGFTRHHLEQVAATIRPMPGLHETIDELRRKGIGLYIVSGNIREIIRMVLGQEFIHFDEIKANDMLFEPDGLIREIRGHDFDFEGKADFLRRIFRERHCEPLEVLFVGNSLNDTWAIRSGARTLCVNPSETDPYDRRVWNYSLRPMENLTEILHYIEGTPPID